MAKAHFVINSSEKFGITRLINGVFEYHLFVENWKLITENTISK